MKEALIGGGLIAGGAALGIGSWIAANKASERAQEAFKNAVEHTKKAEMAAKSLNKLRRISGNDVNIGQMHDYIQSDGMRDNAFYIDDPSYDAYTKKLMAKKSPGEGGTIAIGDDARALPIVAHELGHAENNRRGRMLSRAIGGFVGGGIGLAAVLARIAWRNHMLDKYKVGYSPDQKDDIINAGLFATGLAGIGASIGDVVSGHSIVAEEEEASENAMRYLEKMKRTKEQLARDRETLDAALDTYKAARNWGALRTLGLAAILGGGMWLYNKKRKDGFIDL